MPFDRHDLLERNLDRQIAWIRASDAKISLLLPINTAMVAVLATHLADAHLTLLHWLLALAASLPCALSFIAAVRSVMPRNRATGRSLIYFHDIAAHAHDDFQSRIASLTPEAHLSDLATQVHVSAGFAREKMRHARDAYRALFVAVPFWIAALALLKASA